MKKGNIDFDLQWVSTVTWPDFQVMFAGQLDGYDIKQAYEELTGKKAVTPKTEKAKDVKTGKSSKSTAKG